MERKNYLVEELSKEEIAYLKKVVVNTRRKYIRDNYRLLNEEKVNIYDFEEIEGESILEIIFTKHEEEIKSAMEFEKIISDSKICNCIKALSLKEKMVLFSLYKEDKSVNQIAKEMNIDRTNIWRLKSKALDKIMKELLGGK